MKQNIQELIADLVSGTEVNTSDISSQAKSVLRTMRDEFEKLKTSNDADKQAKMIALFMGGVILALKQDDWKYYYDSNFKLYPEWLTKLVCIEASNITILERIYSMGRQVLQHLPETFNSSFFTSKYRVINSDKMAVFFPQLETKASAINILTQFCINHSNDLECPEIEIDDYQNIHFEIATPKSKMDELLDLYLKKREGITNSKGETKEYFYPFFVLGQKSFTQKSNAIKDLKKALNGEDVDLTQHLSIYRNGNLGDSLRGFIKASIADEIVGKEVTTISEFIAALQKKVSTSPKI
ncbi:hypothetical protein [Legionella hackeliae]|uniref:Uncharacterized protein n=1 Tax=Legionella hackeliae TaxID=449 RepID=A0A0A8UYI4_LEGHA|nr:hypothetical protein [Legionella hackeliae]KTD12419.1 hypothetical protein Lhac_1290 [Legionella hackeliae]CEK11829.1 protein of unknown function [Legionella hackeliae]STX48596.1 Uncharacterised protein [Legionella hackeliae]